MKKAVLEALRFDGYAPRTLLDVGAHLGAFSRAFVEVFPDCTPTLIEPNPYCQEELAKLPFERHAVAASSEVGTAELFLTKEWLQSTGSSLYRENTAFFRDEVVVKQEVAKVRLDELFAGRRFDFVKIDTQGSELDVLRGGEAVLRQADYILVEVSLVEYNLGGARAEAVFAQIQAMGFRQSEATELHRLRGVRDGDLLQIDFLFEREVRRPSQNYRYTPADHHAPLLDHLKARKQRCPDFSVIEIGEGATPWAAEVLDASYGPGPGVGPLHFSGDLNDRRAFDAVLRHVARYGRFSYCICVHTLESLAYPAAILEMLPHIADAGHVAVASRHLEAGRPEGPYRGYAHHRWVLDNDGEALVLAPKINLLEYLALPDAPEAAGRADMLEFQIHWRGALRFEPLDDGVLGADRNQLIDVYNRFFERS